ncbi:MAG: sigma-70 family RNA polymerase sigma factor [Myxococcota bacterium]
MVVEIRQLKDKEKYLEEHMVKIKKVAGYYASKVPYNKREEIFSAAQLGFVQAFNRYSHDRNTSFWTYAKRRVVGAIRDNLRVADPLTRGQRKQVKKLKKACEKISQMVGTELTDVNLAAVIGISVDKVREIARWENSVSFVSLNNYEQDKSGSCLKKVTYDKFYDTQELAEKKQMIEILKKMVSRLDGKEKEVVELLYYQGYKPSLVAERLGVSQSRISQINKAALLKLEEMKENIVNSSNLP